MRNGFQETSSFGVSGLAAHYRRLGVVVVLFLLPLITVGCWGRSEATISGYVTLDGEKLVNGKVSFSPQDTKVGRIASGSINSSGKYTVQAGKSGGLPSGTYTAVVFSREPSKSGPSAGPPSPGKLITPEKYTSIATSGLTFDIKRGHNKIDLELSSQ